MMYMYNVHYDSHRGQFWYGVTLDHEITNDDFPDIEEEIELSIGCDNVRILGWKFVKIINDND